MKPAATLRVRLAVVGVVAVAALGVIAASGLGDSLVYYQTPSEMSAQPVASRERLRLGGMVQPGSVREDGEFVHFVLTDGAAEIPVVHRGDPTGVFQEGQGALVEGSLAADGTFRSDFLVVKHSNEYRGADGEVYDAQSSSTGGQR